MTPLDLTKPVQTRDGRKARIICTDRLHGVEPIVALVTEQDGVEYAADYRTNGRFLNFSESDWDLINVPERLTGYANIYPNREVGHLYPTREEADLYAGTERIGVAYIDTEKLA